MAESVKQKLGFVVAVMMMVAALAVLNLGAPAGAQAKRCGDGGGGGGSPSASPSPTESEEPFPPPIPPIIPEESESASPSPTATAATKCPSKIDLSYQGPSRSNPSRRQFTGKVTSAEDKCKAGRKVILKKEKSGADKTVGTTATNNRGGYRIPVKRANGRYYSQTPKENVAGKGGRIVCGAAKSKPVTV